MRVALRDPATAGLILTVSVIGWDVGHGFSSNDGCGCTGRANPKPPNPPKLNRERTGTTSTSTSTRLSDVLENPELVDFRKEKLGPRSGPEGISGEIDREAEDDLEDDLGDNLTVNDDDLNDNLADRDAPVISTSLEVAEYLMDLQREPKSKPAPKPPQTKPPPSLTVKSDDKDIALKDGTEIRAVEEVGPPPFFSRLEEQQESTKVSAATTTVPPSVEDIVSVEEAKTSPAPPNDTILKAESVEETANEKVPAKAKVDSVKVDPLQPPLPSTSTSTSTPQSSSLVDIETINAIPKNNFSFVDRVKLWKQAKDVDGEDSSPSARKILSKSSSPTTVLKTEAVPKRNPPEETVAPATKLPKTTASTSTGRISDDSDVPDGTDDETRERYLAWKRSRAEQSKQVIVIQDENVAPTTAEKSTTSTRNDYPPPPYIPISQRSQMDPGPFKPADQTIIVQAIRNDGKANDGIYSADFVSGRTVSPPPPPTTSSTASAQSSRAVMPRPFFIQSPEDLFFIDIGEAAMFKLALDAQQSYNADQGVTSIPSGDPAKNWESGPYQYRVTAPAVPRAPRRNQRQSWFGNLFSVFRASDRIVPKNPKDEYTEFAVRRMPSGTTSSRRQYQRLLQRSSYRSPYGYDYTRIRRMPRRQSRGSDVFPESFEYDPWREPPPPPPRFAYDYEFTRPRSRRRGPDRRRRPPPPPPPYYPPRRY